MFYTVLSIFMKVVSLRVIWWTMWMCLGGPPQFRDRAGPDHFRGGDFRRDRFPPRREGCVSCFV